MNTKRFQKKPWYTYAVAACIAVAFYFLLNHIGSFRRLVLAVWRFLAPVLSGLIIAYFMNPLARFFRKKVFKKIRSQKTAYLLSVAMTVLCVLIVVGLLVGTAGPQLVSSVSNFIGNLEGYVASLEQWASRFPLLQKYIDLEEILNTVVNYLSENAGKIINISISAGTSVFSLMISFIMAIYFLAEKDMLREGAKRLLHALIRETWYTKSMNFLQHCDEILIRYIGSILLDSAIVGIVNAIFMFIMRMPYVGLVSFVVAVTNVIPTFGPPIGAVVGAFILLMVKPSYALWFLIFTVILQTIDGYVIKPKLYGGTMGMSGLWILVAIILGGRLFGVWGMLFAIPIVAILTDVYNHYVLPTLEKRRRIRDQMIARENDEDYIPE
ncbi:MAG: AI-2E family transporter [Lachnospiraceae bacterium]|nr:AI-2E family transporter [Lachnospiraceae bacterium]